MRVLAGCLEKRSPFVELERPGDLEYLSWSLHREQLHRLELVVSKVKLFHREHPGNQCRPSNQHLRFHYRGQLIGRTILAMGLRPIPATYRTGVRIPFQLTFGDPLGQKIEVEAELHVDRIAKKKNATVRRGSGLYEALNPPETGAVLAEPCSHPGDSRYARRCQEPGFAASMCATPRQAVVIGRPFSPVFDNRPLSR